MTVQRWMRGAAIAAMLAGTAAPALSQLGQRTTVEQQVFAAESSFAATMARRDSVAFAEFVAPDAVFVGRVTSRGRAEVITAWRGFFNGPAAPFSWRPQSVEVLASGNLALSSGPVLNAEGRQISTFNSVWRRESDGRWRVVFDKGCPTCACPPAGGDAR